MPFFLHSVFACPKMLRKKALPLMACFSHFETAPFSFHLQCSSPKSSLTERSTYLVRISAPAPCGRNRGADITWESQKRNAFFSDCPDQCAALYLVRILSAARCAGFRQEKSPGRVGRCRIPEHPPSTIIRHYGFFFGDRIAYRAHFISCACTGA